MGQGMGTRGVESARGECSRTRREQTTTAEYESVGVGVVGIRIISLLTYTI